MAIAFLIGFIVGAGGGQRRQGGITMVEYIKRSDVLELETYGVEVDEHFESCVAIYDIENLPAVDVVEVVRCGECKYFMPEHILQDDGTRRLYTEEEKKLPFGVTCDVGINCGSRCMREPAWERNRIPVFVQETDFCSRGKRREP